MFKFFIFSFIIIEAANANDLPAANSLSPDSKEQADSRGDRKEYTCCIGDTQDLEYTKQIHEYKRQCESKLRANSTLVENFDPFDCEQMASIKDLLTCEEECFARASQQIDESGKFNRQAIKQHYEKHTVGDIKWKLAALDGYINVCLAQVTTNQTLTEPLGQQCSSAALDLHRCMWIKFRNGCPIELRVDSWRCNKMREHLSQASEEFFHRQLFLKFLHKTARFQEQSVGKQKL